MKLSKVAAYLACYCLSGISFAKSPPLAPLDISLYNYPVGNLPLSSNRVSVGRNGVLFIPYIIQNNVDASIKFTPRFADGVSPIPSTADEQQLQLGELLPNCFGLRGLGAHQKCLFLIMVNGSRISNAGVHGGPTIELTPMPTLSDDTPNLKSSFWSYQPPLGQQLDVSSTGGTATGLSASVTGVTLSVKDTTLNPALTGKARKVKVTNNSSSVIPLISYVSLPPLPEDTSVTAKGCINVLSGNSCTITITPGATATTFPVSMIISGGSDTNAIILPINILTYGTVYQSGYVFSVDDTPADTVSTLGKVAALRNQEPFWPFGIIWASNGQTGCTLDSKDSFAPCTYNTFIPGITETSTVANGDVCNGKSDGACDTTQIIAAVNTQPVEVSESLYAAGVCNSYVVDDLQNTPCTSGSTCYSGWYLPSICEMGYFVITDFQTIDSGCGSIDAPLMQNMASNLADRGIGNLLGITWSSTEYSRSDGTTNNAWAQYYIGQQRYQTHDGKEDPSGVRCVRALTQP